MKDDRVRIKLVTDVPRSGEPVTYTKDSEWFVDAATAAALLLAGAAVKIPGKSAE